MAARKRKASEPETPVATGSRRRSQRIGSSSKKSRYFEGSSDEDSETEKKTFAVRKKETGSRRKSNIRKAAQVSDDEDAYEDDPDEGEADQDDEGDKDEEDSDDDGAPKVTFVPLPKLRDTGGVDYEDDRLHENTLHFLKALKKNNQREWLKFHDAEYRRALKDWQSFVETMTEKIIEVDETIPELPFKDVNFRIYRDIRFSNNLTPYKSHFAAAWSRTGRKGPYACYYIHAEPGSCFVGGGLWHPEAAALQSLRASIDERPRRWRRVLGDPEFGRNFLPSAKQGDEESTIKAFAQSNKEGALKVRPKGYTADHRDIALLKLRNFTVGKKFPDSFLVSADGQAKLAEIIGSMVGFVTHLNNIVMPDPGQEDSGSDDDGDDDDQ